MEKPVIVQVIVHIGDQDGKRDATPEFLDVALGIGPMPHR